MTPPDLSGPALNREIIADLTRAKVAFQQRAIVTHLTGRIQPVSASLQTDDGVVPLRIVPHPLTSGVR